MTPDAKFLGKTLAQGAPPELPPYRDCVAST